MAEDILPWIGVDLDSTLAHYDSWRGIDHIGEPIWPMVERVKKWLADGHQVKIFTARVCRENGKNADVLATLYIQQWLVEKCGLPALEVTNVKDFGMFQLWDDRCIQIVANTGKTVPEARDLVVLRRQEYEELLRSARSNVPLDFAP